MQAIGISVVIAAFNEERLIGKCIIAVKNQTFPQKNYEILVIDNGSTDKTAEIARRLGITVISYTEQQGGAAAKQFGAHKAKGEIIAITDADSIPDPHWLEKIDKLMQNKRLMCAGGTVLSAEDDPLMNFLLIAYDLIARINQLFGISVIWGPNMIIRKDAFVQIGGFDTTLKSSDDWEFVLRIQKTFGIHSTLYTNSLLVKTSPRKLRKISTMIDYVCVGIINYISIFILRRSRTFGTLSNIR